MAIPWVRVKQPAGADMRCEERILTRGLNFPRFTQCKRNAVKDGKCSQHTDEAKQAREKKHEESFYAKIKRSMLLDKAKFKHLNEVRRGL